MRHLALTRTILAAAALTASALSVGVPLAAHAEKPPKPECMSDAWGNACGSGGGMSFGGASGWSRSVYTEVKVRIGYDASIEALAPSLTGTTVTSLTRVDGSTVSDDEVEAVRLDRGFATCVTDDHVRILCG